MLSFSSFESFSLFFPSVSLSRAPSFHTVPLLLLTFSPFSIHILVILFPEERKSVRALSFFSLSPSPPLFDLLPGKKMFFFFPLVSLALLVLASQPFFAFSSSSMALLPTYHHYCLLRFSLRPLGGEKETKTQRRLLSLPENNDIPQRKRKSKKRAHTVPSHSSLASWIPLFRSVGCVCGNLFLYLRFGWWERKDRGKKKASVVLLQLFFFLSPFLFHPASRFRPFSSLFDHFPDDVNRKTTTKNTRRF